MAPKQPCAKYQYVLTELGPKIVPVPDQESKVEESPADYNAGGYLPVKVNDTFKHGRYHVLRKLGWGHFSTVWLVRDSQLNRHSALKVVKSAGRYAETARDEIKLLSRVALASPTHLGRTHIVSFLDSFSHAGPEAVHICIVFEPLGENLLALIERHKKKGVPRPLVKVIAKQILMGLEYLHDECDLVHTDIKPENILISIPDIESHINTELTLNPSPTSRRVGVPLPTASTKSRAGLSITHHQHAVRRQVQIFDSQPLTSPQRSAGIVPPSPSRSTGATGGGGRSGTNSTSESYVAQMHMSRLTSSSGLSTSAPKHQVSALANQTQKPQPPSPLASPLISPPALVHQPAALEKTATTPPPPAQPTSPSTSTVSSCSSLSLTSTAAGSTPATSVSLKMGLSPVHEKDPLAKNIIQKEGALRRGLQKAGLSAEMEAASLWKETLPKLPSGVPDLTVWKDGPSRCMGGTWKDRDQLLSISLNEGWRDHRDGAVSVGSAGLDNAAAGSSIHSGKLSSSYKEMGTPSTSWKGKHKYAASWSLRDPTAKFVPGTSAPAPVVLVSASVSREGAVTTSTMDGKTTRTSLLSVSNKTGSPSPSATSPLLTTPSSSATASSASTITTLSSSSTTKTRHPQQPSLLTRTDPRNIPSRPPLSHRSPTSTTHTSLLTNTHPRLAPPATPPPTPFSEEPSAPPISIKIADLGNATPSRKHYTEDIQTRQYRAPEAIVGRKDWGARVDVWSAACVVFELLTAEYLFDPQGQGELFTKDDDHMAQVIELLGDFPLDAKMGGRYSRELFDHTGALRYIRTLKPWPLKRVMTEKYLFKEEDATSLCTFLHPMLTPDMKRRSEAREMVGHPWLVVTEADGEVIEW